MTSSDTNHFIVGFYSSDKVTIYTTGGVLVHVFGEIGSVRTVRKAEEFPMVADLSTVFLLYH